MTLKSILLSLLVSVILVSGCTTTAVQEGGTRIDTVFVAMSATDNPDLADVKAGKFDTGKMWTFDRPPVAYFRDQYNFTPDNAWFTKARTAALRLSNCSASFVSPNGLVLTNHHCARVAVTRVTRRNEDLTTTGFYANSLDDERRIRDFYADQLISITDVTDEIRTALSTATTDEERAGMRQSAITEVEAQLLAAAGGEESGHHVQVVSLYSGSVYSAYTFKRYDDVRLVQAPELALGYFGGDPDNFTYPRYSLDMSFMRVYDGGRPLRTPTYFKFSEEGSSAGDPVFVVGNPGSTNRLQTMAELDYRRAHGDRISLRLYETRAAAMNAFKAADAASAQAIDLQNTIFSIENTIKAQTGILNGLRDPILMARKADAEADLRAAIAADDSLRTRYGGLFEEMRRLQAEKASFANQYAAYILNPASILYAGVTKRAALAYLYARGLEAGATPEQLEPAMQQIVGVVPYPAGLEVRILEKRLEDLVFYLGADHADVVRVLAGRTPVAAASEIVAGTALLNAEGLSEAVASFATSGDAAYELGAVIGGGQIGIQERLLRINGRAEEISELIAQARFDVFGTSFPPDATFSLRISDGVVKGYEYNGTKAPAYTTFYGLYDRHYSHSGAAEWALPSRWLNHPGDFDLSTPFTFVSTADIIGGNSGSPVLNSKLDLVGLAFDGNLENLPGEFIYTDEDARMISVDSRAMLESLDKIYDADRIVLELLRGDLVNSEREADTILEGTQEVRTTVRGRRRF